MNILTSADKDIERKVIKVLTVHTHSLRNIQATPTLHHFIPTILIIIIIIIIGIATLLMSPSIAPQLHPTSMASPSHAILPFRALLDRSSVDQIKDLAYPHTTN